MATAYTSSKVATGVMARAGIGITSVTGTVTTTGTLITADTFSMVKIPTGAVILEILVGCSVSFGTTVPISIGDTDSATRFGSAIAAGGLTLIRMSAGHGYTYTAANSLLLTIGTASAGCASGSVVTATIIYTLDA